MKKFTTILACTGLLTACGGPDDPKDYPQVDINVPTYAITAQPFTLSAHTELSELQLVQAGWMRKLPDGGYVPLSLDSETLRFEETYSVNKTYSPVQDQLHLRFTVTTDSGLSFTEDAVVPVFDPPLNVGYPLTVKEGREIELIMGLDADFQREIAPLDRVEWRQVDGPLVSLANASSATATFTAPNTDEIQKLTFQANAGSDSTGESFSEHKTVFVVPEQQWVDAVAIHNADPYSSVLRADGTVLHLHKLDPQAVKQESFSPERVVDLNGSHTATVALFEDGTVSMLWSWDDAWPGGVQGPDPLQGLTGIKQIYGTRNRNTYNPEDIWEAYLTESGELSLGRFRGIRAIDTGLAGISFSPEYKFRVNGDLLGPEEQIIAYDVQLVGGAAYLTADGHVGHMIHELPEDLFPPDNDYVALATGFGYCHASIFAVRDNGEVDSYTPDSHIMPPEVRHVRMLKPECASHMALTQDGTVLVWPGDLRFSHANHPVITGEQPSPFNLKNPI